MIQRCENPKNPNYPNYGARGISVCVPWRSSFESFLADMGPRPSSDYSIDRRENDGNYEPGNCRWALDAQQHENRRSSGPAPKVSPEQIEEVRRRLALGQSQQAIADALSIGRTTVRSVHRNKPLSKVGRA
jgi:hypothetical protein